MRKMLLSLAATGAALAVATPAAAQYYRAQPCGYGQGGYGYNNYGQVRALHARINRIEWQIRRLARYNAVPDGVAERLRYEALQLESQLNRAGRRGLNPYESDEIQARVARLEQRVQYASANRYGQYGYGNNGQQRYGDYDRNGRGHWHGDRDENDRDDD